MKPGVLGIYSNSVFCKASTTYMQKLVLLNEKTSTT